MDNLHVTHPSEAALAEGLSQAQQGHGSVWAIVGPPGYGKSTLLDWLADSAKGRVPDSRIIKLVCSWSPGPLVLHATDPGDVRPVMDLPPGVRQYPDNHAYSLAANLLLQLGRLPELPDDEPRRQLVFDERRIARVATRALVEGAKEWVLGNALFAWERVKDLTLMFGGAEELDPRKLFAALQLPLVEALAEGPSLILIDDAHFADKQSAELLFRVAGELSSSGCMLVLAAREREMREFVASEPWHPLAGLIDGGVEQGWLRRVDVGAWSKPTMLSFVARWHPSLEEDEAFIDELWNKTQGHPLFVACVLAFLASAGHLVEAGGRWRVKASITEMAIPDQVEEAILQLLRRADEDVRATIERASIEGSRFHFRILSVLTKPQEPEDLLLRLRSAEHYHRLVRTLVDDPRDLLGVLYAFSHDLIRDVIYARIPAETQAVLHRVVADELIRLAGATPALFSSLIVQHSTRAGDWTRVVDYSVPAAQQAMEVLDWQTALSYTEPALRHVAAGYGDPVTVLQLKYMHAEVLYRQAKWKDARSTMMEVLATSEAYGQPTTAADALALLSNIAVVQDDGVEAQNLARRSLAKAEEVKDASRQIVALLAWHRSLRDGLTEPERLPIYRQDVQPKLEQLLEGAVAQGDQHLEVRTLRLLARVCRSLGDNEQARTYLQRGLPLAHRVGDYRAFVELSYLKINFESMVGDYEAACRSYEASIKAARGTRDIRLLSDVLCNYGSRLKEMQRFDEARTMLDEALTTGRKLGSAELQSMAHGNLASLYEASKDWSRAETEHRQHLAIAQEVNSRGGIIAALTGIARCQLVHELPASAQETLASIPWPERGKHRERADASITAARAHHTLKQPSEVQRAIEDALAFARESGDDYWLAQVLMARVELSFDGFTTGDAREDVEAAIGYLRPMSEKWPASLPLKLELQRALELKRRLNTP